MARQCYDLIPRDVLFFRDARPMDVNKDRTDDAFNIGHGANWPRPDQLFSAAIHQLVKNPEAPERDWYGSVDDLHVKGPFPVLGNDLYLPMPLDWDMKLVAFDDEFGKTDVPSPLKAGFADRTLDKKSYPRWISVADYTRYLQGEVGKNKGDEKDEPIGRDKALFQTEPRVCTTLDPATGASRRVEGKYSSGQYEAEYLRLGKNVKMRCEIETEKVDELNGRDVRFGGQGGLVRFTQVASESISDVLAKLPQGQPTRYVRWTLLTPALFTNGWYPNWLEQADDHDKRSGKVMLPMDKVLRRPGETRAAYRKRLQVECRPFETAMLLAACIGKSIAFSGYDTADAEKPTELAVPAGSAYVFECKTEDEAGKLVEALNLKQLSDLGEKGFGLGVCSYVPAPENF